jgi:hypothetical protein
MPLAVESEGRRPFPLLDRSVIRRASGVVKIGVVATTVDTAFHATGMRLHGLPIRVKNLLRPSKHG